ncbi:hypothetical protein [Modestobacter roseus]|uniref:hypothetical protein n=1 Tax=Modestobacter roseus TaxID=1181884 RepID=UPI0014122BBC|nr:hypothetical protein [Modestobacter roseus]
MHLPTLGAPVDLLWHVLLDLADALPDQWTLVGGQMVLVHALEQRTMPSVVSQDGDVVADVRAAPEVLPRIAAALAMADFVPDISAEGVAHRFVHPAEPRPVVVDVLAPEGLRPDTPLYTVRPGRTIQSPGGTQALIRTEPVEIHHEGRVGTIPCPSLLGAIVIKAAACGLGGDVSRHHRDLALLLSLVADPFAMADQMTSKDRRRLHRVAALRDDTHAAWTLLQQGQAAAGRSALDVLIATDA